MRKQSSNVLSDYLVTSQIDEGSCSVVKKGCHKETKQVVAIKCFNEKWKAHLANKEIAVMKSLDHPNIIFLNEVIDDPKKDSIFLVNEYHSNGSLGDQVKSLNTQYE